MGAIAAYLANDSRDPDPVVRAMLSAAPHRGGRQVVLVRDRCGLGVTALSDFPDVSASELCQYSSVFVGVLDNTAVLAQRLRDAGVDLGHGDPSAADVIAAGFSSHGESFVQELRGSYACVVSDGRRIVCFRDHLGYEPLYYRLDSSGLFAASEAKQVVAGARLRPEPDTEVVRKIFFRTYDDTTPCALKGVSRLPKATTLASRGDAVTVDRYWDPEPLLESRDVPPDELDARFSHLMSQAVGRCLTGEDIILLSGGIDSPGVAAFAAPLHREAFGRPLPALTAVYPNHATVDESIYVERIADRLGIELHTYVQQANELADLERWVRLADGPYPAASLALYDESFAEARRLGARTVLSGEHAEFVFNMSEHLLGYLISHGRLKGASQLIRSYRSRGLSLARIASMSARSLAPAWYLAGKHRRTGSRFVPGWIDDRERTEDIANAVSGPRERWRRKQLAAFGGPGVSVEAAAVCHAVNGVRLRRPWIDVDLWEFFLGLPAEVKFPDHLDKSVVRRLLRGRVPDEILDRKDKTSFNEASLARVDYATLRHYLVEPEHRIEGVDYGQLRGLLESERLEILDYAWAKNLATAHAFLALW